MEASTSPVITPLLHAADAWQEVALLLPVLVGLEIVLSADNAIALAAIARRQAGPEAQQRALNLGGRRLARAEAAIAFAAALGARSRCTFTGGATLHKGGV